ncbi:TonB-dependent receptor [Microvirga sp. SRT01]|uniref:TonB-dependent receptor n=1 Tax=Sphingomonas longa TaxID=2778730 RepID=A0ABS2D967_9SPHN|nr:MULTISPECIES: TonB-dependent receptor [Alphaproteobacteria]MBM6577466.1 TonB-dependent receptor [Sphingomonas sp. BT552]MBR7710511.1 TonB-dependent receptor [Microvirga sp. SRT01]
MAATPAMAKPQTATPTVQDPAASLPPQTEDAADDIVVTGIRASIATSAAQKRDAIGVLDAISSEDLGKFPDANVAESLQRIPGVAIDRSNGEGQSVTVRGLGPQFNTVLFNGRSFASDNFNRAFSFDLIPAELISGAQVYKSSQASLQGGGIGATINIQTPRPLDLKEFKGIVSAKALYEKNSEKFTPQVFGLLSNTFADGRLGLLASLSYQKRIASIDSVTNGGYLPNTTVGPNAAPLFRNVYAPRNQDVGNARDVRTRLGATLVAQYEASDTLTFTVDGLYNKFKSDSTTRALGSWFEPSQYTAATIDGNRTITSLITSGNADFISSGAVRETTTWEAGGNVEWNPTDEFKMVLDATWSRAKNAGGGKSYFAVIGSPSQYSFTQAENGGIGSTSGYGTGVLSNPALGRTHIAGVNGNDITEKVTEYRWNNEWKPENTLFKAFRFGVARTSRNKNNVPITSADDVGCVYCGYPTLADPSLLSSFTMDGLGAKSGSVPLTFLTFDPRRYLDFLTSAAATSALDRAQGLAAGTTAARYARVNGYAATPQPSARVRETVYASYADFDFEADVGAMPLFVNVGARYEYTELSSFGQQRQLVDLTPTGGNPPTDPTIYVGVFASPAGVAISRDSSYSNFLPAANVRLNLTPKLQVRVAAYKTLTRPAIGDLAPTFNTDTLRPATLSASGGNTELKPYRANNADLSLEWYPTPTTTLSAAVFFKKVDDFIVQSFATESIPIANAGNAQGVRLPVGGLITQRGGQFFGEFSVRRPRNAESLEIKGLELNVVHTLDWLPGVLSGFGVQANATFVSTNRDFDVDQIGQSFAAEGIGNSQNATVFYEKYGISARIAYNRRERFLRQLAGGSGNEPIFVRDYGQFDGSVAVNVTPALQVFVEGTNLFNAKYFTTGRFDNQLLTYQNFGPRYDAGVRFSF